MPTKRSSTKPISRINLADQLSSHRAIDLNVRKTQADLSNRFAYVTKARANVWVVVAVVLFIFGLLFSIFYVTKDSTYEDAYNFGGAAFFGDTKLIDPIPEPPLVTGPSHLVVGQDASFTFQVAATTTNATIIEGQWGDGTTFAKCCFSIVGTTSIDLTHAFASPGQYDIVVRARNAGGTQKSTEIKLRVTAE